MKINTPKSAILDRHGNVFFPSARYTKAEYETLAADWDEGEPSEAPHRVVQVLITEIAR